MKSLQGQFLIAAPNLDDPNFFRAVVLMIQHDEEGAMGVILNRSSHRLLREVWSQVSETPCETLEPIFVGGPVPGPILALHQSESLSESNVLPNVHVATQKDSLEQLIQHHQRWRIFLGYAGWAGGQLEAEMNMGGWITLPATADLVFSDPDQLWAEVTQQAGEDFVRRFFPRGEIPPDPSLN